MKTNIICDISFFINLIEIKLLNEFFSLPWEFYTTDMVVHELEFAEQKNKVLDYQKSGILSVKDYNMNEMLKLAKFYNLQYDRNKFTIQECSVLQLAIDKGYTLLTNDVYLKEEAIKTGVNVHDIIYVIKKLVDAQLISKEEAADKIEIMMMFNQRLPLSEKIKAMV